jgi:hypothetical protein
MVNGQAPYTSSPERPTLHGPGLEHRFSCQQPLAHRRRTPRSAATTGARAGRLPVVCPSSARLQNPAAAACLQGRWAHHCDPVAVLYPFRASAESLDARSPDNDNDDTSSHPLPATLASVPDRM